MNNGNIKLNELCSRKLLDMYKTAKARPLKVAIEAELLKRDHFTSSMTSSQQHH